MPELRNNHLTEPLVSRLALSNPRRGEILRRHAAAVSAGVPSYSDPLSGLTVMTAAFLAQRDYCCLSGCRHCPYVIN
jgi:hypothetical protein